MAYATYDDLLEVEPTITEYGILEWAAELARSETEINRLLVVRWWPIYQKNGRTITLRAGESRLMNTDLLDPTQWRLACVYHALAYHIFPKLTKFEADQDSFERKMNYYAQRFETEFDLCVREGVRYDDNENDVFDIAEKLPTATLRLRR